MELSIFSENEHIKCRTLKPNELSRPTKETCLPIVIEGNNNVSFDFLYNFAQKNKKELKDCMLKYGAILFRGFDVVGADQFRDIIKIFCEDLALEYKGTAPRKNIQKNVFTTTEVADDVIITPHTEMAYSYNRPGIVAFYCDVEPDKYGETPIFNCASVYDSLSQEALKILEKGVKYIRKHPKKYSNFFGKVGVSWPQSFSTENKEEVEKSLKESGFDFEWGENEELKIISYPPAIVTHPITNKKGVSILFTHYINEFKTLNLFKNRYSLWARCRMKIMTLLLLAQRKELNLVNFLDHNGKEFPHFLIKELHNHFWDYSVIFPWKKNDILLLDNRVIAHGRMNVHGPRRILAILGDIYSTAKVK